MVTNFIFMADTHQFPVKIVYLTILEKTFEDIFVFHKCLAFGAGLSMQVWLQYMCRSYGPCKRCDMKNCDMFSLKIDLRLYPVLLSLKMMFSQNIWVLGSQERFLDSREGMDWSYIWRSGDRVCLSHHGVSNCIAAEKD